MKFISQKKGIIVVFAIVAIVIFWFSMSVNWIIDNFTYQFSFATKERIRTIGDIFPSMSVHYLTWNGRYVGHWLVQLFVSILGKPAFSVCNALVYIGLISVVVRLGKGRLDNFGMVLTGTVFTLFFADLVYEPTCQISYIWVATLTLTYLMIFFREWKAGPSPLMLVMLFIFSLIAGNGQESMTIGVGGAMAVYFLLNLKRVTRVQWILAVGYAIGALALCLTPANFSRAGSLDIPLLYSMLMVALSLRMTYVFLVVLIWKLCTRRISFGQFYKENAFFVNAIVILVIFNFLIGGVYVGRQFLGVEIFSTILALRILKGHTLGRYTLAIATLAIIGLYMLKYVEIEKARKVYIDVADAIHSSPTDTIYVDVPLFNKYMNPAPTTRYGNGIEATIIDVLRADADVMEYTGVLTKSYPAIFKEIRKEPVENRYVKFNPEEYLLMQDKRNPKKFILHRKFSLLGISFDLPPYEAIFDADDYLNTDQYNIEFIPMIFPFIHNTGVEIADEPAR